MDKLPPNNLEAEQAAICCLLTDSEVKHKTGVKILPEWLYSKKHKVIATAINDLHDKNINIDLISLKNELIKSDKLAEIGGLPFLMQLIDIVSTSANFAHYVDIVKEHYQQRKLIIMANQILEAAYNHQKPENIINMVNETTLNTFSDKIDQCQSIDQLFPEYFHTLETRKEKKMSGITTGLNALDSITSGIKKGDLTVIAARPSMGKTQLALKLSDAQAEIKEPSLVVTMEMENNSLIDRYTSAKTGIKLFNLKNPANMTDEENNKLQMFIPQITENGKRIYLDYSPSLNIQDLEIKIRLAKIKYNISTVFIDYLGLMEIEAKGKENKTDAIGRVTRKLKNLAGQLDIAVVLLSQLNRELEKRPNKRPILSDLRDSGSLEQDADLVILIYRESVYCGRINEAGEDVSGKADLIIAKQRNGAVGDVQVRFSPETVTFHDF